jgi:hypothetical protein
MEHVTPKQEQAMYTASEATSKYVTYGYDCGHPDADADGFVTFVTLAWDQAFIATAMPGRVDYDEACILATCEMNSPCTPAAPLVKVIERADQIARENGCDPEDALARARYEADHNLIP